MAIDDDRLAALRLADRAHEVGRASGRKPWRVVLRWISGGRFGQRNGWREVPKLDTPWQGTISNERVGWRQRAANLHGDFAFALDYRICRNCWLGWVEQPYTLPQYQRCGLAAAGLAALRAEHPGLAWYTLGGHFTDSHAFWNAVGAEIPGGYEQHPPCLHVDVGG
ncbi:hypothetical protein [Streptomyces hokutonensis]|uniref:GNAT family N-acetyltransferase n=1 Tax=Streptomyces hokutonensis TaxID=1306990 RepID=A0ABW6LU58_9ACTN